LLTGALPFRGNVPVLLQQVRHEEPPPPRRLDRGIPRDLETVCLKAMAKEADQRYASAQELAEDLRRFLAGQPVRARRTSRPGRLWRWCRRKPVMATLLAVILVLFVALIGVLGKGQWARHEYAIHQPNPDGPDPQGTERSKSVPPGPVEPPPRDAGGEDIAHNPDHPSPTEAGDVREVPVGRYLAEQGSEPSVLLARRGPAYPWAALRPNTPVLTAQTLLSLPGYRSEIVLDKGVQLTLWGNVPQFCAVPPLLLESVVMLHEPRDGADLDLTLEWGRIKLANRKDKGPAHVRLHFQREVWDLTLPSSDSEACAELWATLPVPAAGGRRQEMPLVCGLFTKGVVTLRRDGRGAQQLDLRDTMRVAWISVAGAPLFTEKMEKLPGWWTERPDPRRDEVADIMLSLNDWVGPLNGREHMADMIQAAVGKSDAPGFREQGMFFLEALDEAPYLVNLLEDPRHERVRRAAIHALRSWLTHSRGRANELPRLLQTKLASREKADLIFELLHPLSEEDRKRPETYQKLITLLNDNDLAVRELAFWHLEELAPVEATQHPYNPAAGDEQRREAVADWQKLLPPGSLPQRRSP
jgi:hypothetical protein